MRALLAVVLLEAFAHAAPVADLAAPPRRDGVQVAADGTFLPTVLTARIGDQRVAALSLGGYDTTPGRGAVLSTFVEGALFHRVALRAGMEYVSTVGGVRPSVAVRVGLLRQERHHIDLAVSLAYKNLGFSEARGGELEIVVALARRWGKVGLFGNLVYGQGIDRVERDAEARLGLLYAVGRRVNVGLDARARLDLGEDTAARRQSALEDDLDVVGGPLVTVGLGPIALVAQAGGTAVVRQERPLGGFLAQGGLGGAF